mmetsp:Transcript_53955/g.110093  ORF Transcript_53955/g.110093 Transcript_53955/m.110093 type:complete len:237 (-) Transcript_53955:131-841(-)
MQVVVLEEDARHHSVALPETDELLWLHELRLFRPNRHHQFVVLDCERCHVAVFLCSKGKEVVHVAVCLLEHFGATCRVVLVSSRCPIILWYSICPVQCVHKRTPSCVGSVEDEPRVIDWTDQLGPRNCRDLRIDLGRGHLDRGIPLWNQVSDLFEEIHVMLLVDDSVVLEMVFIDLFLKIISFVEKFLVTRAKFLHYVTEGSPELVDVDTSPWRNLILNQLCKSLIHFQTSKVHSS